MPHQADRSKKAPSLLLLVCLLGFPQISETIYTPSLPQLARSLNITSNQVEFTLSIYFVGFAIGVLTWGILADHFGRRRTMLVGILTYILGSIWCGSSHFYISFLSSRLIQGFGASVGSVVTQTMVRDLFSGEKRTKIFSILGAALSLSPALGPFIGGRVNQFYGWRANFVLLIALGLSVGIYSFFSLPETRKSNLQSASNSPITLFALAKRMALDIRLLRYAFLIGACNGIVFSYYAEAPFIFIDVLKLTPSQYGSLGMTVAIPFLSASKWSHHLISRFPSEKITLLGTLISLLGATTLLVVSHNQLISLDNPWIWVATLLPLGILFLGIGLMIPNCLSNALSEYQEKIGTAGSILGFSYYVAISLFTALMSVIHDGTTNAMPAYFFGISLAMVAVSAQIAYGDHRRARM